MAVVYQPLATWPNLVSWPSIASTWPLAGKPLAALGNGPRWAAQWQAPSRPSIAMPPVDGRA